MNISKLQTELSDRNADAIFVANPMNIYYLTGFRGLSPEEREVGLLVTKKDALLFLPEMYQQSARELEDVRNGDIELVIEKERDNLMTSFVQRIPQGAVVLYEGNNLLVSELNELQSRYSGVFQDAGGLIEELRIIKTEAEIEKIKKAVEITDETWNRLVGFLRSTDYTRFTELDIADELRRVARELGGEGFSFDPIVASGAGSAEPHYFTGNKKLQKGELLLVDLGIKYQGYCGDLTRCVFLGKAPEDVKNIYAVVLESLRRAIEACRSGAEESSPYSAANGYFQSLKLDHYFLHRAGHGIGLAVHEEPSLFTGHTNILRPNMTITIEPGLYFAGKFGIRIEDYVIVREGGCEVLSTKSPKQELIEI